MRALPVGEGKLSVADDVTCGARFKPVGSFDRYFQLFYVIFHSCSLMRVVLNFRNTIPVMVDLYRVFS